MNVVSNPAIEQRPLRIPVGPATLDADLSLPAAASGLVLFAHGSGSSRFSPRNRHVARLLNEAGLATVLADLLTPAEEAVDERTRHLRFDIGLLAERLVGATGWVGTQAQTGHLTRPDVVRAVVSRGVGPTWLAKR